MDYIKEIDILMDLKDDNTLLFNTKLVELIENAIKEEKAYFLLLIYNFFSRDIDEEYMKDILKNRLSNKMIKDIIHYNNTSEFELPKELYDLIPK